MTEIDLTKLEETLADLNFEFEADETAVCEDAEAFTQEDIDNYDPDDIDAELAAAE